MKTEPLRRPSSCGFLILVLFLALGSSVAPAQDDPGEAPPHAHLKRYGVGWECDRGYRKTGDTCVAVEVPPNGYLSSFGDGWDCDRGYRKTGDTCVVVHVPSNGHLVSSGHTWTCDAGYRRERDQCVSDVR
jgi:hypothetical protein